MDEWPSAIDFASEADVVLDAALSEGGSHRGDSFAVTRARMLQRLSRLAYGNITSLCNMVVVVNTAWQHRCCCNGWSGWTALICLVQRWTRRPIAGSYWPVDALCSPYLKLHHSRHTELCGSRVLACHKH